ncbi:MAG: hypothetical protein EP298_01165 [Gammaproteobacteria bacterium]|nr:MAG: hypothetical protein EP298_01165 [Gammaproteobacteria bacterium]UTW41961.1 hypothetical protein KFE69_10675 [bacterium SCSIO 12844]
MFQLILKLRQWFHQFQAKRDPYLEILHVASATVLAVIINGFIYLYFQLDNFFMPMLLGCLMVLLCNIPFYQNKTEKYQALIMMYAMSLLGFSGSTLFAISYIGTVSFFLFLAFFMYLGTLKKPLYRLHVSLVLTLSAVLTHLADGSFYQVNTVIINVTLVTVIAFLLTRFYPEREVQRVCLGLQHVLEGIENLTQFDELSICKEHFYQLSQHTLTVSNLVKKLPENDQLRVDLESAFYYLRLAMLSIHMVYAKCENNQQLIVLLHHLINDCLKQQDSPHIETKKGVYSPILIDAMVNIQENFEAFFSDYELIKHNVGKSIHV